MTASQLQNYEKIMNLQKDTIEKMDGSVAMHGLKATSYTVR